MGRSSISHLNQISFSGDSNDARIVKMKPLHSWEVSPEEALRIQGELRNRIVLKNKFLKVETVAGADVFYSGNRLIGAIAVLSYPQLELIDSAMATGKMTFPYIPGLFSFREGPILLKAFDRLKVKPDLIIFEGHGIAHPRRFGLASHLGLWLNLPSIGCARTSLLKEFLLPRTSRGSLTWVYLEGEKVGAVLRTRQDVQPVFVSPGYGIDLETSVQFILSLCPKYRIPEPLRVAHRMSRNAERKR